MSDATTCPACQRPTATAEQWATLRGGEGVGLCWGGRQCDDGARDAARREADGLRAQLAAVSRARDVAIADVALWRGLAERRGAEIATLSAGRSGVEDAAVAVAERVAAERDALRALLARAARGELPRCDSHYGGVLATKAQRGASYVAACDECAGGDGWSDLPHAAALRAAMGGGA